MVKKEFEQRKDVDHFETFAAVVKAFTSKPLFTINAHTRLHFHQIHTIITFFNSCQDIYFSIKQLKMFNNVNNGQVLRLQWSFYNLKQHFWLWFDLFTEEIRAYRFYHSQYDNALFFEKNSTYVALYFDNLQIIDLGLQIIVKLETRRSQSFKMTDLGPTSQYLEIEILISEGEVTITQKIYVEKILE